MKSCACHLSTTLTEALRNRRRLAVNPLASDIWMLHHAFWALTPAGISTLMPFLFPSPSPPPLLSHLISLFPPRRPIHPVPGARPSPLSQSARLHAQNWTLASRRNRRKWESLGGDVRPFRRLTPMKACAYIDFIIALSVRFGEQRYQSH